jgi:hypothetical protein
MVRNFSPIEFEPTEPGAYLSRQVYEGLRSDIASSKHASRFEIRKFTLEPTHDCPSPFDVDIPYLPPLDSKEQHRNDIAELAASLVMEEEDWGALVDGFKTAYQLPEVANHLASGGVVKFIDSHRTYTGQVMQEIASWQALKSLDIDNPHEIQTTIISRVTTLFKLTMLKDLLEMQGTAHHDGAIIEDVLLQFSGALLTIPNSHSGNRLVQAIHDGIQARSSIVERTKVAYANVVNRGGSDGQIMFEGSSGTENHINEDRTYRIIGAVKERTAELTTDHNQSSGAERILAVPIFMESDPYTGDPKNPIKPSPTPFAFLAPRFPKSQKDFDQMMMEIALAGTQVKASGELPYRYERRAFGRDILPEFIVKHTIKRVVN